VSDKRTPQEPAAAGPAGGRAAKKRAAGRKVSGARKKQGTGHGDLLRVNSLFIALDDDGFDPYLDHCIFKKYKAGDIIVDARGDDTDVYFVVEGTVRIVDENSSFEMVYNDVDAGGWFGEIAAIDEAGRSATVTALTGAVCAMLPRAVFLNMILEHRTMALRVLEDLTAYVRWSNLRMRKVTSYTGVQRVYIEILQHAVPDPTNEGVWRIFRTPTHKDLAQAASTSPEIVARAISQLLKEGLVTRSGGGFTVLDRPRIEQMISRN
jgi:CRP-like cAMP-binding protein